MTKELTIFGPPGTGKTRKLIEKGAKLIGLGARDTLRLEAGLNLSGTDMNTTNNPYESNLGWTVDVQDPDRNFVGKEALYTLKKNNSLKLVGCISMLLFLFNRLNILILLSLVIPSLSFGPTKIIVLSAPVFADNHLAML